MALAQALDGYLMDGGALQEWMTPWSSRATVRLILIAEIQPSGLNPNEQRPIGEVLGFDRLQEHVNRNQELLPQCLASVDFDPRSAFWNRAAARLVDVKAHGSVWTMPGSGTEFYVQLVDIVPNEGVASLVAALEDMYYGDLIFPTEATFGVERSIGGRTHQLVVFSETEKMQLTEDDVQRLIYRANLPADPGYTSICRPDELNRRPGRGAALGPFVSVLWGQQDYIENCAFLSVLTGVAASAVIVDSRRAVLANIARMGNAAKAGQGTADVTATRQRLDEVRRAVARAENRIALCIDGLSTLMPYIPALRVESYHRALFEQLDTAGNREALERLLRRLSELVRMEADILAAQIAGDSEARARRWTLSVGAASVFTIPFGFIFGFFGVAASEVDPTASMFSLKYWPVFALVVAVTLTIALVHYGLYRMHRAAVAGTADGESSPL